MSIVIFFFASLLAVSIASTTLDYSANQKYSYTGRSVVTMTNQIQTLGSNWASIPATITIPLPKSFSINNSSSLQELVTLGQFQSNDLTDGLSVFVQLGLVSSIQINAKIYTSNALKIQKLTIFYAIFVYPDIYATNLGLYYSQFNFGNGYEINSDPALDYLIDCTLPSAFNTTGTIKVVVMISGLVATYTNSDTQTIDVSLTGILTDPNTVRLTVTSNSAYYTFLKQIMMNIIIYNLGFINFSDSPIYRIYDGTFAVTSSFTSNYTSSLEMASINTFIGLSAISINNINSLSFYLSTHNNTIYATSDLAFSSQNSLSFVFVIVFSYYCDYKTPYYSNYSSVCYNICPDSDTSNDTTLKCQCNSQGNLAAESKCSISSQSTSSSSASVSLGVIIGAIVGAVFFSVIIILVIIKICRSCPKQQIQQIKGKTKLRDIIYFDPPQMKENNELNDSTANLSPQKNLSNPPSAGNVEQINRQATVQPPRFHQTHISKQDNPSKAKKQQLNEDKRSHWKKCSVKHLGDIECCICKNTHTFLRSECNHYFHLACMSKWLATSSTCPICRAETKFQFRYYCNLCMLSYRSILIGSEPIDQAKFQKRCEDCKQIPL